jgi:hypothetical protein
MIRWILVWLRELPLRIIEWMADGLEWLFRWFAGGAEEGFWGWVRSGLSKLFWVAVRLVAYPVSGLFLRGSGKRAYWWSMPAVLLGLFVIGSLVVWGWYRERILTRYLVRVQSAYSKGEVREGEGRRYAERWIRDEGFSGPEKELLYGLICMQNGSVTSGVNSLLAMETGRRVLEILSPEDSKGLGVAHFWRAGEYLQGIESLEGDEFGARLEKVRWHVERTSGVAPGQIALLRGRLASWENDLKGADAEYRKAWEASPGVGVEIAQMYRRYGDTTNADRVLRESAERLLGVLGAEPRNRVVREQAALAYEELGQWRDAEGILVDGLQWSRDELSGGKSSASASGVSMLGGHYERRMDRALGSAIESEVDYRELSYSILRIVRLRGVTQGMIQRVIKLGQERGWGEMLVRFQQEAQGWLVEGGDPAVVHLGLGVINWGLGELEKGRWHVEQGVRIDGRVRSIALELVDWLRGEIAQGWQGRLVELDRWVSEANSGESIGETSVGEKR